MEIELRPATLADADTVADLETAHLPDDPIDGVMVAYWWTHAPEEKSAQRLVAGRDGRLIMLISASHGPWGEGARHFGWGHTSILPGAWRRYLYRSGIPKGEWCARKETAHGPLTQL